jgi:ATP-dependent DNA helicase RecG
VFGDLEVSTLSELPPGRTPVKTKVIRGAPEKVSVYAEINQELEQGRQAYFIYPLVNESEADGFTQLKSAVSKLKY